jgi:RNA polymerase sigma-70 factor (ECF subfamily)
MQRELVERAIDGDQEAFASLVDASVDRLYAVATMILRDSDRAQDAVQDALVSAWRDVRALRDPDAWGPWLHRLTVWACYRVARKDRRRNLVELKVVPDLEPAHPFDVAAALADRDLVERSMNDLTLDHRAVIVLRFYLDLSVDEVARILDIPPGTVKSRIHRGLAVLRAHMADPDGTAAGYPGERTA